MNTVTKLLPSSYDVLTPNMSMVVTHDVETASGTVSMVVVLDVLAAMINALKIQTMLWTLQLQKRISVVITLYIKPGEYHSYQTASVRTHGTAHSYGCIWLVPLPEPFIRVVSPAWIGSCTWISQPTIVTWLSARRSCMHEHHRLWTSVVPRSNRRVALKTRQPRNKEVKKMFVCPCLL